MIKNNYEFNFDKIISKQLKQPKMINEDLIKRLAKNIDERIDWVKILKKPIIGTAIEFADNFIFPEGLKYLNEKFGSKIPDKYVDEIEAGLEAFIVNDYQGVIDSLPEGLDDAIDIKFMEDDFEALFIATNFNALVKAVKFYALKKAA